MNIYKALFRAKNSEGGFTLIEMFLVLVILAIGFSPLLLAFSNSILASSGTTSKKLAVDLARQQMEIIASAAYSDVASTDEAAVAGNINFSRSTSAEEIAPNLKEVTVTVSWKTGPTLESCALSTYKVNY